jgi:hypothetical protein
MVLPFCAAAEKVIDIASNEVESVLLKFMPVILFFRFNS